MRAKLVVLLIVFCWSNAQADRASTFFHKAMAHKKQGQVAEAIAALKQAVAERKGYAAAHRSLGVLYRKQGNTRKALEHLEKAAALQPQAAEVHYSLGLAYFRARQRGAALKSFAKAAALEPANTQYRGQYGILLLRSDPEKAIAELSAAVKQKPRSGDYVHQLGLAYRRAASKAARAGKPEIQRKRMKLAEQYLIRASGLKDGAGLHFDLGVLYRRQGNLAKAAKHYERAVDMNPKLAAAWWDLGHVRANAKQYDGAVEAYGQYLKLKGSSKDAAIARERIKEIRARESSK